MGKLTGFKEYERKTASTRPITERVQDYEELYIPLSSEEIKIQAARCMDCGVPFCSSKCPLGNVIPSFNDLVYTGQWKKALDTLHSTNNFPEFTGKVCPAPCEAGCVLGINQDPVTIKQMELAIINKGFEEGWVSPQPPSIRTSKKVAVVGSGPSGLAAAQQLNRAGHSVTVFERADRIGGLLSYGIPDFKLEKWVVDRRVQQMADEGVVFKTNANVGVTIPVADLQEDFDAICLTGGSTQPRDLVVSGRELNGVHFAMDYLTQQNTRVAGKEVVETEITAKDKTVVVIGGGDTGADCIGTAIRQGAKEVIQLELLPKPPLGRDDSMPWPTWPMTLRTSTSHEEGGSREWSVATKYFSGTDGKLTTLHCIRLEWSEPDARGQRKMTEVPGSEFEIQTELVLFAMGFVHPEHKGMLQDLGVELTDRGNIKTDDNFMTCIPGIFAAGDMRRGQSLVVWAISEGRKAAKSIDEFLMGESRLKTAL